MARRSKEEILLPGMRRRGDKIEYRVSVEGVRFSVYGKDIPECIKLAEIKEAEVKKGLYSQFRNITLEDFFEKWQEERRIEVRPATVRKQGFEFDTMAKQPIDAAGTLFGSLRVRDITKQHCLTVRRELLKYKKVNSTNQSIALLKHILEEAIDQKIIEENPARRIKAIEVPQSEKINFTTHRALTLDETARFLEEAKKSEPQYYNMIVFLLYTGMRHGEAGALRFCDVHEDIDGRLATVVINKTISKNENGRFYIGDTTKTKSGVRTIRLPKEALQAVKDQRLRWIKERGRFVQPEELIFTATDGGLCDVTNTTRACWRICKAIGIPKISCHALRATFATRYVENSRNYKTLSSILGHKDITVTMNTYAKALDDTQEAEILKLKIV